MFQIYYFYAKRICCATPLITTFQTLACGAAVTVTAPAIVPTEPTTNWLSAVAIASRPKIKEPLKLLVVAPLPTAVLS